MLAVAVELRLDLLDVLLHSPQVKRHLKALLHRLVSVLHQVLHERQLRIFLAHPHRQHLCVQKRDGEGKFCCLGGLKILLARNWVGESVRYRERECVCVCASVLVFAFRTVARVCS